MKAAHARDAAVWQSAALLLGYPDDRLLGDMPTVHRILGHLSAAAAEPLHRVAEHLATTPLTDLQTAYVETFDTRRRHNLYLTYFAHGDTRKRGAALLRFKQTYLRAGFALDADDGGELPDHLCVVLEFAATVDHDAGRALLLDHRAGLELLRLSLTESRSPWAGAPEAVCSTLPALHGDEWDAVRRLAAEGPPAEEVGLSPYGGPAFDARLHEATHPETTDLPMPVLRQGAHR
ncbi:MAG TPA: nitrate reductase molybdenum cofactor assembly chaperone [Nocardioides sp.]|uniref:nitrate reductase molybdenum cofactor assembly chaperone n=1 Tax=Nocardioides sp. TaxID=35761 RepID=UPI002F3E6975